MRGGGEGKGNYLLSFDYCCCLNLSVLKHLYLLQTLFYLFVNPVYQLSPTSCWSVFTAEVSPLICKMCGSEFLVWNSPSFQGHLQPAEGFQTVWPKSMLLAPKVCLGNHERLHFWHGLQVLGWYVAWTLWCCVSWTWVFLGQDLGRPVTQGREWVNCRCKPAPKSCEMPCGHLWRLHILPLAGLSPPPEEFGSGWWQRWSLRPHLFLKEA